MAKKGGNPQNLIVPTSEQARINGAKGGYASQAAQKARKTLREELLVLLEKGDTQEHISLAQIQKALQGDTKAFEVIRDTIGEKQPETVDTTVRVLLDGETGDFAK